jgi:uncharacterized pyridoxamine 5'-phosphate oxidase family protein
VACFSKARLIAPTPTVITTVAVSRPRHRLSNYQVSISNKADFSTHTYQQDFHVTPNPKKIIQLNGSDKQGRYVRIQLLRGTS